jgi:hypothetical protein
LKILSPDVGMLGCGGTHKSSAPTTAFRACLVGDRSLPQLRLVMCQSDGVQLCGKNKVFGSLPCLTLAASNLSVASV